MFTQYKFGAWKKEIRELLSDRLKLKVRLRYHKNKISHHQDRIKSINKKDLLKVEKKLDDYLKRAGN